MVHDNFSARNTSGQPLSIRHTLSKFKLVMILFLALCLAACSTPVSKGRSSRAAQPTPIPAPSGVGPDGEALSLEVVDGSGTALITNAQGFVVYGIHGETPSELVCVDDCLLDWVPVQPRDDAVSTRLDMSLYATFVRPDGTTQVTYKEIPLYTWSGDASVGIANGAGVAGLWFVISADGELLQ